jgi:CUG-BP- and ETR3-like factor
MLDTLDSQLTPPKPHPIKVFVGQVPKQWNEEQISDFFRRFCQIRDAQVIRDSQGVHKGCAFITFFSITEAEIIIQALNENYFLPGVS